MEKRRRTSASYVPTIPAGTTGTPDRNARSATPGNPGSSRPRVLNGPSGKIPTTRPRASASSARRSAPTSGRARLIGMEPRWRWNKGWNGVARQTRGMTRNEIGAGTATLRTTPSRAVACDGGVVLLDGGRELVVLVVLLHEEEVLDRGRIEDSVDRAEAGIGDRPGREPRPLVGVVGVIDRQVGPGQRPPILTDRVLHGRVGLERHPPPEAGVEDRRAEAALLRRHRLALHDRRQREQGVDGQAPLGRAGPRLGRELLLHALHHPADDLLGRHAADELIGVGGQI